MAFATEYRDILYNSEHLCFAGSDKGAAPLFRMGWTKHM